MTSTQTGDWLIFWAVAAARFLLPLAIPRYPLPAILASLLLDGVDQTLFQQFTALPLDGYQGYDKALDIYYLTIAYISTLRNWPQLFAIRLARLLFYWRLVGVALFELTGLRPLLLIFPNVFEYFFIFYEGCRLRWAPARVSRKVLIAAAVLIWVVIKLPQEYWIHIAQIDTTDWLKTSLFQVSVDTSWLEILQDHAGLLAAVAIVVILIVVVVWRLVARRLPPSDRALSLAGDAREPLFSADQARRAADREASRIMDAALGEKIVLITLVSVTFAHVLPTPQASDLELVLGLGLIVTINTAFTHWLLRWQVGWALALWRFLAMAGVNLILALLYPYLLSGSGDSRNIQSAIFFAVLLTLLITLFDRYRQVYLMRFEAQGVT